MSVIENLLVARHARFATSLLARPSFARKRPCREVEHRRAVEEILEFIEL